MILTILRDSKNFHKIFKDIYNEFKKLEKNGKYLSELKEILKGLVGFKGNLVKFPQIS